MFVCVSERVRQFGSERLNSCNLHSRCCCKMNCLHKFIGRMHIIEFRCKHKYNVLHQKFHVFFLSFWGQSVIKCTSCKLLFHATRQNSGTFRFYYLCVWPVHKHTRTSMCVLGVKWCQVPSSICQVLETSSSMLIGSSHFKKSVWAQVSQLMQSRAPRLNGVLRGRDDFSENRSNAVNTFRLWRSVFGEQEWNRIVT